jgi:cytochrome-b5 reductase
MQALSCKPSPSSNGSAKRGVKAGVCSAKTGSRGDVEIVQVIAMLRGCLLYNSMFRGSSWYGSSKMSAVKMIRSRLLCARLLSTSAPTSSPTSSRLRFSSFLFFTSTGILVSSYFLWPSKYRGSPTYSHKPLSPEYFIPATVCENSQAGPDLAVLTLSIPPDSRTADENASSLDPIWSIFVKDDDIQVERPYTPLCGFDANGNIKLWIKRYPRGEVGRWLHSKQAGDTVEIRGPSKTFPFVQGKWDEVVMVHVSPSRPTFWFAHSSLSKISGGTGFSPFHQLLFRQLLRSNNVATTGNTRFTLLHASRSPAELPPLPFLQRLIDFAVAHPEHFRVRLFVDSAFAAPAPENIVRHLKVGRMDKSSVAQSLGISDGVWTWTSWISSLWVKGQPKVGDEDIRKKNVLVLVCGPERYVPLINPPFATTVDQIAITRMVAAIAGPYGKNYSQGKVGGVLAELGFKAEQVWKL